MIILPKQNLSQAADYLQQGKTVIFPTATSYGLGCDATNQLAVDKIFQIKQRSTDKPLLIVVPSLSMAKKYIIWDELTEQLANKYWPGVLTIIANKKLLSADNLAKGVVSKENTIAIRVTNHPVPLSLSLHLDKPIVATSANLSGGVNIYDSKDINNIFSSQNVSPDALLDYGQLSFNQPSTMVRIANGKIEILRQGGQKV